MEISTLIADPVALRLDCIRPFQSAITLIVRTTLANAERPLCALRRRGKEFVGRIAGELLGY